MPLSIGRPLSANYLWHSPKRKKKRVLQKMMCGADGSFTVISPL